MRIFRMLSLPLLGILILTGCSSVRTQNRDGLVSYNDGSEREENFALLPRTTAKEAWASKSKPLPPLPNESETAGPAPVESSVQTVAAGPDLKTLEPSKLDELVRAHRGSVLVINCWGIDCGPCVEELPHLDKIQEDYKNRGLKVIAINTDVEDRHEEVRQFVAKNDFDFEVYLRAPGSDTKFRQSIDPEYAADPYTLIFDKEGNRVASIADALPEEGWEEVAMAVVQNKPFPITDPEIVRLY